jgi:hypothetical protein
MAAQHGPPRGYAESHTFQQNYDAVAERYPEVLEIVGALLWGIGENPLDFNLVPGHGKEGMRVAKSVRVLLGEEVVLLRIFFTVPKSGPIEIQYLDIETADSP